LRIAVLAHSFPRFAGDTHGPFVKRLSEELARRGHEVWVLIPYDPELRADPATPLRILSFRYVWPDRLHRLGYSRTLRRDIGLRAAALLEAPLYFHFAERALTRLLRRERIELVHAHWILPNGYIAARAARRAGARYAVTLHGSDVFMAERSPLFGRLARRALRDAAYVTSCSDELRGRLLRVGGAEHAAKVHLVANGTDPLPVGAGGGRWRERLGIAPGAPLVVAAGRLVDKKGFDVLLEAAPVLRRRWPAARIVIGGGGDLLAPLRDRARALEVADMVSFTGGLSHPEMLELIAAADLFVMPSVRDRRGNVDGLPVVVLEAMAASKPVVASDVSGLPLAVQHGATGLLVPERDPQALAEAMAGLLADPARARRLGEAGRRRVEEELNWSEIARQHDELLRASAAAGTEK
jgi:glycosyltransferase involved in cell wall biosynthesis